MNNHAVAFKEKGKGRIWRPKNGRIALSIAMLFTVSVSASAQNEKNIIGKWKEDNRQNQVEFFLDEDGCYYDKVVNGDKKEVEGGFLLFRALKFDAATKTNKGILVPPGKGIRIDVTISFLASDKNRAVGKKFLLGKTFCFTRIGQ
ncbi:MAG: hypothetical protein A2162_02310 [Deltaproteobacteria bacterium RBG_13_52_11b]|nr:MAG: hypothetical protein A2162_02310 [Deltaproteobacteria bacterium RBG_13_52_11b]